MKLFGRRNRAFVRVLVSLAGVTLIVGLTALPAYADTDVTSFTPSCGVAATGAVTGTSVTITGTGFSNGDDVKFNTTTQTTVTFVNSTQVVAEVPNGASTGKITVLGTGADNPSTADFTVVTAALPTISSFIPTAGAIGTSVSIIGTNFCGTTAVTFNTTNATSFKVNSATSITATVPTGATTGPIKVTTPGGTGASSTNFTVVPAPTITSFTPAFGPVGTQVKITGANFSGTGFTTTSVTFNGVAATTKTVDSPTQITATVPSTATTGTIKVTTPGGSATTATNFTVSKTHSRSITFKLKKSGKASGAVSVGDGFTACTASVPVKIQRKSNGNWKNAGTTTTTATGSYSKKTKGKPGKYRAIAPKVALNNGVDVCLKDKSPTQTIKK